MIVLALLGMQTSLRVGADVSDIGKVKPGTYLGTRDLTTIPKIEGLSSAARKTYSGCLFVLGKQTKTFVFSKGFRLDYSDGRPRLTKKSVEEFLTSLPKGADIRWGQSDAIYPQFWLPRDDEKLRQFHGTISYVAKTMKVGDDLRVDVKGGKITAIHRGRQKL